MLRRMLVFRIVAAADVAARSAEAEMHPCVAQGEALLAARGIGAIRDYELEVAAFGRHQMIIRRRVRALERSCKGWVTLTA